MFILSNFAETLGELMFENNLDGKALGSKVGSSGTTITRYLRGDRYPTVDTLIMLADYFHCSTDFLLGIEKENYSESYLQAPPFPQQFSVLLEHFGYDNCIRFSADAHIHESSIYAWKNGRRAPSVENVVKIAEFFGCTVDSALGRTKL